MSGPPPDKPARSDAPRFYFARETCKLPSSKTLWHLLSDIYLAPHTGEVGGGNNNQRAFNLREEKNILT